jgi:multiple sugar transport system ATP-binding protein
MHAVTLRNVGKSFGPVQILKGLSLDIAAGDFTVLLGASGCGKSTLLSIIAGLEDATSGTMHIGDVDMTDLPPKDRGMAMVFQSYALYPTMTVRENLSFGLRMAKVPKAEIDRRVQWAADMLKLGDYFARKPAELSGGQRQRVAIGRAIVREAKVYLFDEPLSNLDAKLRTEMRLEIRRLHAKLGATMIYVTHDQIEAMTMATRIAVMRAGVVEQYATPQVVYNQPQTLYVAGFIGSPAMNFLDASVELIDGVPSLRLAGGTALVGIAGYGFRQAPRAGQAVVLGVRPEDIVLVGGTPLLHDLTVDSVEMTGADAIVWALLGEQRVSVRCAPADAPAAGTKINLGYDPTRASVFDAGSEQRL